MSAKDAKAATFFEGFVPVVPFAFLDRKRRIDPRVSSRDSRLRARG